MACNILYNGSCLFPVITIKQSMYDTNRLDIVAERSINALQSLIYKECESMKNFLRLNYFNSN